MKLISKKHGSKLIAALFLLAFAATLPLSSIQADTAATTPTTDINSSSFKLIICDGPELPKSMTTPAGYVPCNFKGLMMQIQHFINIAIIGGVLVAICGFTYAGFLYVKGEKGDIDKAHKIFPAVAIGFAVMLSAWFIVYQILSWLLKDNTLGVLLGTP